MLNLRDMEYQIAERRSEIERDLRQAAMIRQLAAREKRVPTFHPQHRLRCQLGLALIRLGNRIAA